MISNKKVPEQTSYCIAYLRFFACMMIVSCHYLQSFNNDWAYVLNTGVQIFLLISGYLYGYAGIRSVRKFYSTRMKKIYIPYLLWTGIVSIFLLLLAPAHFNIRVVIAQVLMLGRLDGQSHLWFIPVLFLCYLVLPLFTSIKKQAISLFVLVSFIIILLGIYFITQKTDFLWIMTYYIGYLLGRVPNISKYIVLPTLLVISILICNIPIIKLFTDKTIVGQGIHILSAVAILCLSLLFPSLNRYIPAQYPPPPTYIGKFEFEIYIVHQTFLIGPLAVIFITDNILLNIIISILSIGITTLLFCLLKKKILNFKYRLAIENYFG